MTRANPRLTRPGRLFVIAMTIMTLALTAACSSDTTSAGGDKPATDGTSTPVGDKTKDDKKDGKKADRGKKDIKKDDKPPAKPDEKPSGTDVVFPGSPFDEENQTFEIKWQGEDGEADLYATPDKRAAKTAKLAVKKNTALTWKSSRLRVTQPLVVVASKDTSFNDTTPHDKPSASPTTIQISKGAEVKIFKYEGEGTCIIEHQGVLLNSNCPQQESFTAASWDGKYTPPGYEWWIEAKDNGWLQVDGKDVVGGKKSMLPGSKP